MAANRYNVGRPGDADKPDGAPAANRTRVQRSTRKYAICTSLTQNTQDGTEKPGWRQGRGGFEVLREWWRARGVKRVAAGAQTIATPGAIL